MKNKLFPFLILTAASLHAGTPPPFDVILDFENNTVTGGTLVLLDSGSGATNDFTGDRFDEQTSADFEIQGITGVGTLSVTATALAGNLNVTTNGLQDGSSGYGATGEGTHFNFDKDVTITFLDWVEFSTTPDSDSVELLNDNLSLGSYTKNTVSGGINFTDTNPSTMSISVTAGDDFTIKHSAGTFYLGQIGFTVVPEPNIYAALAGLCSLAYVMLRRRKQR
jgi:hypothetical protein